MEKMCKDMIIIAGPCVIESESNAMYIAEAMKKISERLEFDYYFKASFDKANRTSIDSYRGTGINEGLKILQKIKDTYSLKICTDIHEPWQAERVKEVADIIQIPAFLCRQTDLLVAAANTGKIINVKKAQFLAPWDMKNVVKKIEDSGNHNIMLCERGSVFGYNALVVDMTSIIEMKKIGYPVVFDATHSVQKPGGNGVSTGGNREYVEPLAKAAIAVGADALFFEVHPDPDNALSDGPNMVKLDKFENMMKKVMEVRNSVKKNNKSDNMIIDDKEKVQEAQRVFDIEISALKKMRDNINESFIKILNCITSCEGKVIITGIGKPGHIGTKIAATLSSLGTPSFFLHPAEAEHGDLGMVSANDLVIAISYSGESDEIIQILPNIKLIGAKLVGITANEMSTLAKAADIVQILPEFEEACHLGLAPSSSATVELVYGDALAITASRVYGFSDTDFGKYHPAGSLGKKLVLRVEDIMFASDQNATISEDVSLKDAIVEISKKELGMVSVVDDSMHLLGIITSGDLRRIFEKNDNFSNLCCKDVMTRKPIIAEFGTLAVDILRVMANRNIAAMPVVKNGVVVGAVRMSDILKVGIEKI